MSQFKVDNLNAVTGTLTQVSPVEIRANETGGVHNWPATTAGHAWKFFDKNGVLVSSGTIA